MANYLVLKGSMANGKRCAVGDVVSLSGADAREMVNLGRVEPTDAKVSKAATVTTRKAKMPGVK